MTGIITEDLSFQYKETDVFEKLNLTVPEGQWVGLLGANGTGKTTFLKILVGLLNPQNGRALIMGRPPGNKDIKNLMSSSFQDVDFPEHIRVREVLEFVSSHYTNPLPLMQISEDFFLDSFLNKKCSALSGGMKRRLSLALAMLGRSKVLLLDEPTTGLDQASRMRLLKNIETHRAENQSLILMISHYPEDLVPYVNQFLVFKKETSPQWISPDKVGQLTLLKKVQFHSEVPVTFDGNVKVTQEDCTWSVITSQSDEAVRSLAIQNPNFSNLSIEDLSLNSILEDHI